MKMEYTGNVSKIIDQSQQQAKPAARNNRIDGKADSTATGGRTDVNDVQQAGNTILMMKK